MRTLAPVRNYACLPMRRFGHILAVLLGGVLVLALVGGVYVYAASERIIHRRYDAPLVDIEVPSDSASIAEGHRLAMLRGCPGCHGEALEGEAHADNFMEGHTVAPNLTATVRTLSTAEFARAVRHGVRANGEGLQEMPSPMFYHLSDADLGRIIAYVQSLPPVEGRPYRFDPGPSVRWLIAREEWLPWPEDIQLMGPRMVAPAPGDTLRLGEYLARTVCSECHGFDLLGGDGDAPPLTVGGAYPDTAFVRLMRTGIPLGERDLRLMDDVARSRFTHFTDAEIAALHAYLQTLLSSDATARG